MGLGGCGWPLDLGLPARPLGMQLQCMDRVEQLLVEGRWPACQELEEQLQGPQLPEAQLLRRLQLSMEMRERLHWDLELEEQSQRLQVQVQGRTGQHLTIQLHGQQLVAAQVKQQRMGAALQLTGRKQKCHSRLRGLQPWMLLGASRQDQLAQGHSSLCQSRRQPRVQEGEAQLLAPLIPSLMPLPTRSLGKLRSLRLRGSKLGQPQRGGQLLGQRHRLQSQLHHHHSRCKALRQHPHQLLCSHPRLHSRLHHRCRNP